MEFNKTNWRSAYQWLEVKQEKLIRAYEKNDTNEILKIQVSILKDCRTTAIAVRRVASNKDSSTPGVDGKTLTTSLDQEKFAKILHKIMRNPSTYKPNKVTRIWARKDNGDMQLLKMLTIQDRLVQAVYLEAIAPIVEAQSCSNSFGFRKLRSAKDAVLSLRGKLIHPKASEWVFNADISKCFDRVNHEFLLRHVPLYRKVDRNVIRLMLKAKIIKQEKYKDPEIGTPQGSLLSPVLNNIALNGLEKAVKEKAFELVKPILKRRGNPKVHVVRYVDGFIIVGPSKKMLVFLIPIIKEFLSKRGLEISKEKFSIFNLWESDLDFLRFSFRKRTFNYRAQSETTWKKRKTKSSARVIILPNKVEQRVFKSKVREIVKSYTDVSTLIIILSKYLRSWANYFNVTSSSAEHVRKCHRFVFWLCWRKVKRLYSKLTKKQLKKRFFPKHKFYQNGRYVTRAWVFSSETKLERASTPGAKVRLYNLDSVKAPGNPIIRTELNAYLPGDKLQLEKVMTFHAPSTIERISRFQNFICPVCRQSLKNGETLELHHSPNLKTWQLQQVNNKKIKLFVLHKLCHLTIHKKKS
jgi:RNA-directed DNA polymerase